MSSFFIFCKKKKKNLHHQSKKTFHWKNQKAREDLIACLNLFSNILHKTIIFFYHFSYYYPIKPWSFFFLRLLCPFNTYMLCTKFDKIYVSNNPFIKWGHIKTQNFLSSKKKKKKRWGHIEQRGKKLRSISEENISKYF